MEQKRAQLRRTLRHALCCTWMPRHSRGFARMSDCCHLLRDSLSGPFQHTWHTLTANAGHILCASSTDSRRHVRKQRTLITTPRRRSHESNLSAKVLQQRMVLKTNSQRQDTGKVRHKALTTKRNRLRCSKSWLGTSCWWNCVCEGVRKQQQANTSVKASFSLFCSSCPCAP